MKNWINIFGQPKSLFAYKGSEYYDNVIAKLCFFGTKCRTRYAHTPWANGLVESKNKHTGRFIRASSKQNNIHRSDQADIYTCAHETQILSNSTSHPYEMVSKEKPSVPIEFHLETTRDHQQTCTSHFRKYLPTHSHNTISDENTNAQPLLTKPLNS